MKKLAVENYGSFYQPDAELRCDPEGTKFVPNVGVLADSQLHNYFGAGLKTGSRLPDTFVRVAIRPTALNLWSDLVLESFVDEMIAQLKNSDDGPPLLFFLGDATDVACTGEFDRFLESMKRPNVPLNFLMAHGNHDSFMYGNFNRYMRHEKLSPPPSSPKSSIEDIEDSEYTPNESRDFSYKNVRCQSRRAVYSWAAACAEPTRESRPMSKGVWLRRYLAALQDQQVQFEVAGDHVSPGLEGPLNPAKCDGPRMLKAIAMPGSPLARRDFLLSGMIYSRRRIKGDPKCGVPLDQLNDHRSFVVQSIDINSRVRAIIIDTDVRADLIGPWQLSGTWPGSRAWIDDDERQMQLREIRRHVYHAEERGRRVILFGHHPLVDMSKQDQLALAALRPIAYISGHTHLSSSAIQHSIGGAPLLELNVASTTDWPMESLLIRIEPKRLDWRVLGVQDMSELEGGTSLCGYQQASWSKTKCEDERNDYLNYRFGRSLLPKHGLCTLREEIQKVQKNWPGDRAPFTLAELDAWKNDPDWTSQAQSISNTVEALRKEVRLPGSQARDYALCAAIKASRKESTTLDLTKAPQRNLRSHDATRYSGADF